LDKCKNFVSAAVVCRVPRDKLEDFFQNVALLPDVLLVHKQASFLKLYVSEYPPKQMEQRTTVESVNLR
jgi:hypothetical protein